MSNASAVAVSPFVKWKLKAKRVLVRLIPPDKQLIRTAEHFLRDGEREVHLLSRLVTPGTVAIDVGAHIGDYTYALCKQLGPSGHVIAIEPQPALARHVSRATKRLRMPVTVHNCALSSKEGEAELMIPLDRGVGALGLATLEHRSEAAAERFSVRLRRLDDLCRDVAGKVSFIKIDVEGHELDVLQGAGEILKKHRPNLLIEIEQRHCSRPIAETFAHLADLGYRAEFLNSAGNLVPFSEFDLAKHQDVKNIRTPYYVSNFVFWPQ